MNWKLKAEYSEETDSWTVTATAGRWQRHSFNYGDLDNTLHFALLEIREIDPTSNVQLFVSAEVLQNIIG